MDHTEHFEQLVANAPESGIHFTNSTRSKSYKCYYKDWTLDSKDILRGLIEIHKDGMFFFRVYIKGLYAERFEMESSGSDYAFCLLTKHPLKLFSELSEIQTNLEFNGHKDEAKSLLFSKFKEYGSRIINDD